MTTTNPSLAPSALLGESSADDPRLLAAVKEYQAALERGERCDRQALLARHSDIAEDLREHLEALDLLRVAAPQLSSAGDEPLPGAQLGEFRLLREIGRGGMGVVYEAVQEPLGRHVALKVLVTRGCSAALRERFQREAQAAAKLHHTNIVPVFDVGQSQGLAWYAMQFIRGCSLDAVLKEVRRRHSHDTQARRADTTSNAESSLAAKPGPRSTPGSSRDGDGPAAEAERVGSGSEAGRFGHGERSEAGRFGHGAAAAILLQATDGEYLREVAKIAAQTADALEHAHRLGVLHRDVKPSNLLLDEQGAVWVCDFGLARIEGTDELTHTGDLLGTLRYMSPEQLRGEADPRSDVYGLGVTLYELIALRPPLDDRDRVKLIQKIELEQPPAIRQHRRGVPRDLETIVHKAMDKDPQRRYATAGELAEDLRSFLDDRPIRARPFGPLGRLLRWCRRKPLLAALAATVVVATLAVVGTLSGAYVVVSGALTQEGKAKQEAIAKGKEARQRADDNAKLAATEKRLRLIEEKLRRQIDRDAAQLFFEKVHQVCVEDDPGVGLFRLAEALKRAVRAEDRDLEQTIRRQLGAWGASLHRLDAVVDVGFPIRRAVFSPDGSAALVGDGNAELRLWDLSTRKPAGPALKFSDLVKDVRFDPAGKRIAVGTRDRQAQVFDPRTGEAIGLPILHPMSVTAVCFSPAGDVLWTGCPDRTLRRWKLPGGESAGEEIFNVDDPSERVNPLDIAVRSIAYTSDGAKLLIVDDRFDLRTIDLASGVVQRWFPRTVSSPTRFLPMRDKERFLIGNRTGDVSIWDYLGGQHGTSMRHSAPISDMGLSADQRFILSASEDGTARAWNGPYTEEVWRAMRREARHTPFAQALRHRSPPVAVGTDSSGRTLFTAASDGLRIWQTGGGQRRGGPWRHTGPINAVAWSPDGMLVLTGGDDRTAQLWNAATEERIGEPWLHNGPVTAVAFHAGGHLAATATREGRVHVWSVPDGRAEAVSPANYVGENRVDFLHSERELILSWKNAAMFWKWREEPTLRTPSIGGGVMAWDPAHRVALTSHESQVWRVQPPSWLRIGTPFRHASDTARLAWSPDGRTIVAGTVEGELLAWDANSQNLLWRRQTHEGMFTGLACSHDSSVFAAVGVDGQLVVGDLRTGRQLGAYARDPSGLTDVSCSPRKATFITTNRRGEAQRWDIPEPVQGSPGDVVRWAEALTGMTLDGEGQPKPLDAASWRALRLP